MGCAAPMMMAGQKQHTETADPACYTTGNRPDIA